MQELAARVPEEPAATDRTAEMIKFRLPDGKLVTRRFPSNCRVQTLWDFVGSLGFFEDTHLLAQMAPRRVLDRGNNGQTIKEAGLSRAQLIVEARD